MAQVIYPSRFWPASQSAAAVPVGLTSFGALAQGVGDASAAGVQSLRSASDCLGDVERSGADVCAHAETLEDLALLLDQQMQQLIDRTRSFTAALRGDDTPM